MNELKLFIPGPTWIRHEIRLAGSAPEFGHRDTQAVEVISTVLANLMQIAELPRGYFPALINGSGSNAMESAVLSLVSDSDRVLCICLGAFGELFYTMMASFATHVDRLDFLPGKGIDLQILEEAMARGHYDLVTLTHNESSTGVISDIVGACNLIRAHGALPIVDGVSLFGGAPSRIAEAQPAVYVTATQKCLALPPGFGIIFANTDALNKAETVRKRTYTLDMLRHIDIAREGQTLTTPNCTLLNQMREQTNYIVYKEGILTRFARHKAMQQITRNWVRSRPERFQLFTDDVDASPALTSLYVNNHIDLVHTKNLMRKAGYLIDTGYAKLNRRLKAESGLTMMRIPHMGDVSSAMLEEFLETLDSVTAQQHHC